MFYIDNSTFLSHMVIMEGSQLKALFNIAPYSHEMNSTSNPEPCNPKLCMLTTPSPGHIVKYGNKIIKQEFRWRLCCACEGVRLTQIYKVGEPWNIGRGQI